MAKTRQAVLIWSQEDQQYLWRDEHYADTIDVREKPEAWLKRLAASTSFSFQGREGHLTLLKEARPRGGDGYWYAYRRQGKRTAKKYAGRTADLTAARLEQMARALRCSPERIHQVLSNGDASGSGDGRDRQATDMAGQHADSIASSLQIPLLVPKLHLPPLHPLLVPRERLLTLLDRALEHRLTLVSAPAGFGKTTLVRQWVAERSTQPHVPPVAWVSLDRGDNDPVRFWRYLLTACQVFGDDVAREALALLLSMPQPPFEASLTEMALTVFLNALAQCEQGGILLLDDYHAIISPRIQQTMTFFLTYLPASIHVVIMTRSDPPFSLVQLRARNELCDVRASDLRFSLEETSAFLQQELSVSLAPEIVQRVDADLEGWAAGLRLLLIVLRESALSQEIEPLLRVFAGGKPTLQDYFLTEVFNTLPEPLQRFVLQTSVLARLTGPLCAAITGERESERMLETVARANLFLEPLGSSPLDASPAKPWYRYHGLWASAMRAEARRRLGEEQLRARSAKASRWYETHHLFAEAVESALYAQDYLRAAVLIERILQEPHAYYQANEYHTLYTWLEQLPEAYLAESPALCLGYARALLYRAESWRLSQATLVLLEKLFQMAEERYRAERDLPRLGEVFAFRSLAAWRRDDAIEAARYARQALAWLSEEQQTWRALSLGVVGKVELLYNGHVDEGYEMLEEAYTLCEATDHRHFRLSRATINMLARALFERGELHRSCEYYQGALHEAREGYVHSDDMAHALCGLARISYERNELEMARQQAEEMLAIGQYLTLEFHEVQATLLLARIQHAQGETAAARQRMDALLARLPATQLDPAWPLSREILTLQARLALADGDLVAVQRWITGLDQADSRQFPFASDQEMLMLARWYLAQGRREVALRLLRDLERAAQETGRRRSAFEAQALLAQVYAAHEQPEQSQHILLTLLAQTCTKGYLRLFLDEGEAMAVLLRSLVLHVREQPVLASLQSIIRAFPRSQDLLATSSATLLAEPLSSQELRVLHLLVPGRSNAEIARELVVSVNTVRTHVQNIYRKLDAHNRAAAVEVARQLHLIS
ncbi:helix-turn-helix transcriptional regulator [Ktedonobacteria bacterium brp13]|nr:helix-turn-helix transcriptional regulator [Ktedonobacteria bacterium brp13]